MKLLLFDIDGTLIQTSRLGRQVIGLALSDVFGTNGVIEKYNFAGKTDLTIIHDLLEAEGVFEAEVQSRLHEIFARMRSHSQTVFTKGILEPCPGIDQLMKQLLAQPEITLGLQTGNIRETATMKLLAANINPVSFTVGAYGSDARIRADLIPIAWSRAMERTGIPFSGKNTIVIGDTPADVECARINGARSIAVATGTYSMSSLWYSKPDYLLPDLSNTEGSLELLLN